MESNDAQLTLHDQLYAWFDSNKQLVLWGTVGVAAVALVAGIYVSHTNSKELRANEALSKLTSRGMAGAERAESPEAILKVAADYPNTAAGIRAQLLGAASLFAAGKYPDAKTQFEKYLKDYRDTPFASQAQLGVAACLGAQNQTNEAITAYSDIIKRHPNDNVASQARLALARIYEAQNKLSQAKDLYEELFRTFGGNSQVGSEAGSRLQELFTQHPELFPVRSAATNAPVAPVSQP